MKMTLKGRKTYEYGNEPDDIAFEPHGDRDDLTTITIGEHNEVHVDRRELVQVLRALEAGHVE
jgi:hypothetical protein